MSVAVASSDEMSEGASIARIAARELERARERDELGDLRMEVTRLRDALRRVEDDADSQVAESVAERERTLEEMRVLQRQLRDVRRDAAELQAALEAADARNAAALSRRSMTEAPRTPTHDECEHCRLRRAEADMARQEADNALATCATLRDRLAGYHRQLARADEELAALKHSVSMADAAVRGATVRCEQLQNEADELNTELSRQRRLNSALAVSTRRANAAAALAAATAAAAADRRAHNSSIGLAPPSPPPGSGAAGESRESSRRNSGVADTLREMHEAEARASLERRSATAEARAAAAESELARVRARAVREAHQLRLENSELCDELVALRRTVAATAGATTATRGLSSPVGGTMGGSGSTDGRPSPARRLSINSLRTQSWLTQLQANGVRADDLTHSTVILSALRDGSTDDAVAHLVKLQRDGVPLTAYLYERVITALCKDGRINAAERVYDLMDTAGLQPSGMQYRQLVRGSLLAGEPSRAQTWLDTAAANGCDAGVVVAGLRGDLTLPLHCRAALEQLEVPSRIATPIPGSDHGGDLSAAGPGGGVGIGARAVLARVAGGGQHRGSTTGRTPVCSPLSPMRLAFESLATLHSDVGNTPPWDAAGIHEAAAADRDQDRDAEEDADGETPTSPGSRAGPHSPRRSRGSLHSRGSTGSGRGFFGDLGDLPEAVEGEGSCDVSRDSAATHPRGSPSRDGFRRASDADMQSLSPATGMLAESEHEQSWQSLSANGSGSSPGSPDRAPRRLSDALLAVAEQEAEDEAASEAAAAAHHAAAHAAAAVGGGGSAADTTATAQARARAAREGGHEDTALNGIGYETDSGSDAEEEASNKPLPRRRSFVSEV